VPFSALSFTSDNEGKRVVTVPLSKERLPAARISSRPRRPSTCGRRSGIGMGQKAIDKAGELRDEAAKGR
jgi:hypothetical protein